MKPSRYRRFIKLNQTIGSPLQLLLNRILTLGIIAPSIKLILALFFRVKVEGAENIGDPPKALFASQHYFEWDPLVTFTACLWPKRLSRPDLMPFLTAAPGFWGSTHLLRAVAWMFCIIWFIPGHEPEQGCLGTIVRLIQTREKFSAVIFPTGPIGRTENYRIRYGIGWVARQCPDIPIFPVKIFGIQNLRFRDLLLFRRPSIRIEIGKPFFGQQFIEKKRDDKSDRMIESDIIDHLVQLFS